MFYRQRTYSVTEYGDKNELAHTLTQHSWSLFAGFRFENILFLNDSAGEYSPQEYAVFRVDNVDFTKSGRRFTLIESFTVSLMEPPDFLEALSRVLSGESVGFNEFVAVKYHDNGRNVCRGCKRRAAR